MTGKPPEYKAFMEFLYGKLVADKGYISKRLFERLFVDGIQLVTKLKNNMRGAYEHVRQVVVEKESHYRNRKRRVEEYCASRTFQTQVV